MNLSTKQIIIIVAGVLLAIALFTGQFGTVADFLLNLGGDEVVEEVIEEVLEEPEAAPDPPASVEPE